jgi:hypothetical protein
VSQPSTEPSSGPRQLLAKPDFRRVCVAGACGQLGDAFQFVAVLWYAVLLGGPEKRRLLAGVVGMRVRPGLRAAVAMHAVGVTVNTGVWTVGVAEVAHSELGSASGLSLILTATAVGAIAAGAVLSKLRLPRKVFFSCVAWSLLLPGYLLLSLAHELPPAIAGTFLVGVGTGAAFVLLTSATQESVAEGLLGRAMGIIYLGSWGAKPVGLILIAPLFAFVAPSVMFVAGGVAVFVCAVTAVALVDLATRRYRTAAAAA